MRVVMNSAAVGHREPDVKLSWSNAAGLTLNDIIRMITAYLHEQRTLPSHLHETTTELPPSQHMSHEWRRMEWDQLSFIACNTWILIGLTSFFNFVNRMNAAAISRAVGRGTVAEWLMRRLPNLLS
jgi:hypothetical protein